MNRTTLTLFTTTICLSQTVTASDTLEPVVVTATRTEQKVSETLSAVTIITREEINRSAAQTLPELIAGTTGVDVITSGGYGKSSKVYIRGSEGKHVLLLVDGVRFHDTANANNEANFQYLPLDIIERVEIVRGPKASLYGSDAIGGVIQVFTRQDGNRRSFSAGMGTENTQRLSASLSGDREGVTYSLRASRFQTDGISTRGDNEERDGYENTSAAAHLEYDLSTASQFGGTVHLTNGTTEYDNCSGSDDCLIDFTQWAVNGYWKQRINDQWESKLQLGKSDHERLYKRDAIGDYHGENRTVSWLNDYRVNDLHTVIGGVDYSRDLVSQSYTSDVRWSRESIALFANLITSLENGDQYSLGLRNEDNQQFGNHITGDIAYEWLVGDETTVRAAYGEAFKAPTLYNLYNQPTWDQTLQPERSRTIELSVSRDQWTITLFKTRYRDLINYKSWTDGYENIGKAKVEGLEAETQTTIGAWLLSPTLTVLNPVDQTSKNQLQGRSKRTLKLHGERRVGRGDLIVDWIGQSRRYSFGNVPTAGYGKVDMGYHYPLSREITLRATVGNLLDQEYQLNNGFNTEGRNAFITLNYRM